MSIVKVMAGKVHVVSVLKWGMVLSVLLLYLLRAVLLSHVLLVLVLPQLVAAHRTASGTAAVGSTVSILHYLCSMTVAMSVTAAVRVLVVHAGVEELWRVVRRGVIERSARIVGVVGRLILLCPIGRVVVAVSSLCASVGVVLVGVRHRCGRYDGRSSRSRHEGKL